MAMSNRDRLERAFAFLSEGLEPIVDTIMTQVFRTENWPEAWAKQKNFSYVRTKTDVLTNLSAITDFGRHFNDLLTRGQQAYASELRETRNKWAHQEQFTSGETSRALETIELLLGAVDAVDSADDVRKLRLDLQRQVFSDSERHAAKRIKNAVADMKQAHGLLPWREVIQPQQDVINGNFSSSEFAADLYRVSTGEVTIAEYADPVEFFNRTYITEGLNDLLTWAVQRLTRKDSSKPVVNLQTNFGGGKTHSMLALYHLFSGVKTSRLPQEVQDLVSAAGANDLSDYTVNRAVLVGTNLTPGAATCKPDGTIVRTLWGELAWQLGGAEGYAIVEESDRNGTNPGSQLDTLLRTYGPCLILIDEWVAYARQLVGKDNLPAGTFDTQFSFAQTLTEAVSSHPGAMLIVSIPASDATAVTDASDIEIGGDNGRQALDRLQNIMRRKADHWRPSSRDESFEIVRRRLFRDIDANGHKNIGSIAKTFANFYREFGTQFPPLATSPEYERRLKRSYPLHPELLDRLYEDWSTLERFQRTRGVLNLVAAIVHELWKSNDTSPLIMPASVPLEAPGVNTTITQYFEDSWRAIIDSDVDGDSAAPAVIDQENPSLGSRHITQRLARTVFMGATPRLKSSRPGLDKQSLWLGTAMPGDALGNFGNALEKLEQKSTYFYNESTYYWFDTQQSLNKTVRDIAEQLREQPEEVWAVIQQQLETGNSGSSIFGRVHFCPLSGADVPDDESLRLVFVHPSHSYSSAQSTASKQLLEHVRSLVESKSGGLRINKNMILFIAADERMVPNLEQGVREYIAWRHVVDNAEGMNLSTSQIATAKDRVSKARKVVDERLRDTFSWLVYPVQDDPTQGYELSTLKITDSSAESIVARASKKLKSSDLLTDVLSPFTVQFELANSLRAYWTSNGEISVKELWAYYCRYPYMNRLANRAVLDSCLDTLVSEVPIDGAGKFALAQAKIDGSYRGIVLPGDASATPQITDSTLLVDFDRAFAQWKEQKAASAASAGNTVTLSGDSYRPETNPVSNATDSDSDRPTIFNATKAFNADSYGKEFNTIADEIIKRLMEAGAQVTITVDIHAVSEDQFSESDVRTLEENATSLEMNQSFE